MAASKADIVRQILGSDTTDKSVHAQAILEVVKTATDEKEAAALLAIALIEKDSVPKKPVALQNKGIAGDQWDELARSHAQLVHSFFTTAFFKSDSAEDLANRILDFMKVFQDEDERVFLVASLLFSSPFVPYKQLPGTMKKMTQHQFEHIIGSNTKKAELIRYITKLPFSTTVELASMVLQVLDDTPENDLRLALLALTFNVYRAQQARMFTETMDQ